MKRAVCLLGFLLWAINHPLWGGNRHQHEALMATSAWGRERALSVLSVEVQDGGRTYTVECSARATRFDEAVVLTVGEHEIWFIPVPSAMVASPYQWTLVTETGYVHVVLGVPDGWGVLAQVHQLKFPSPEPLCAVRPVAPQISGSSALARLCGAKERYRPVMLTLEVGEGIRVGSGIWADGVIATISHVGDASPMRVWVWGGETVWVDSGKDVALECMGPLCLGVLDLAMGEVVELGRLKDGLYGVPTHVAEEPRIYRFRRSLAGLVVVDAKDIRAYHIHAGASGSPLWRVEGGRAYLVGLLAGAMPVVSYGGDGEYYFAYARVCSLGR